MEIEVSKRMNLTVFFTGAHFIQNIQDIWLTAEISDILSDALAQLHSAIQRMRHHDYLTTSAARSEVISTTVLYQNDIQMT